jgi:hypothetical protein
MYRNRKQRLNERLYVKLIWLALHTYKISRKQFRVMPFYTSFTQCVRKPTEGNFYISQLIL